MKNKYFQIIIIVLSITLMFALIGCRAARKPMPKGTTTPGAPSITPAPGTTTTTPGTTTSPGMTGMSTTPGTTTSPGTTGMSTTPGTTTSPGMTGMSTTPGTTTSPGTTGMSTTPGTTTALIHAKNIADQLASMKQIKTAHVVIGDKTAIVGLKMDDGYSLTKDSTLVSAINQKVKSMDAKLTRIEITEDSTFYSRIEKLSKDIDSKKPMNQLEQEFKAISDKIRPAAR